MKTYFNHGLAANLVQARLALQQREDRFEFIFMFAFASLLLTTAAWIFLLHGYHAGFIPLNQLTADLPASLLAGTTFMGDTAVPVALVLLLIKRYPAIVPMILLTSIIGMLLSNGLKSYFAMPRPPAVLPQNEFNLVGQALKSRSFPSGHSATIFIFTTLMFYATRSGWLKALLLVAGSIIALSRVFVGAHWLIDVLVGSALGILVALIAIYLAKRWPGGFHPWTHHFALVLVLITTCKLFYHDGGYPQAQPLAIFIAAVSLGVWLVDYFISVERES